MINFFLFDKIWCCALRMGCDQKFHSLNKIISKKKFSNIFFPKYPYKSWVTIKNMFGHIISHIILFWTMFWVPGVTLLRLLRCTNKRHFDLSKEHSATPRCISIFYNRYLSRKKWNISPIRKKGISKYKRLKNETLHFSVLRYSVYCSKIQSF